MEFKSDEHRKAVFANINKGGSGRSKSREESGDIIFRDNTIKDIVNSGRNLAPLVPYVVPQFQVIYTAYKIIDTGIKLYNFYNKIESEEVKNKIIYGEIKTNVGKISEPFATPIARKIRKSAENSNFIEEISDKTKVNKEIFGSMLEGTIKERIISGAEDLTSYII